MLISRKYEVESQLGKGSMGLVYKVRHVTLGAISALKVLPSHLMENSDLLTRFYREARVMAKLIHPNIVRVIDIDHDVELNFHYFVMEYIQGRTLREYLQEKKVLSLEEILRIARQVANALQFAHNNDPPVIHRDIKPANIMLEYKTDRAVLMDFGIAKELDEADMTRSEMMLGTVRYCPREQMLYETLDGSADIYALGMIMYEAYTGKHLFSGLNENQVISKVLSDKENEPIFDSNTPVEFKALITKAIAKTRDKRYKCMAEFLTDLEVCWSLHIDHNAPKNLRESNADNITDLDEQIHRLEQEKKKRLALFNRTKCQETKEQAIQEDAEHSVEELYLEGCAQEITANDYLIQEEYTLAQEAFETATNLFSEAYLKAFQVRLHEQAKHIKHQVQAIKAEADDYNAKEKARTLYGRALNFQSQAEELLESASFKEAYENFSQAYRIFEDARELAYHKSQKEETEAFQAQAKEAYEQAVKAEAEELAPTFFKEALLSEQKAEAAFSSEDFFQANELYRVAIENYSLARHQGIDQRKRQAMVAAQKQAEELWHRAEEVGAAQRFSVEFAKAVQLKEQGQHWEAQQKPEKAAECYGGAANAFEYLQRETELSAAREQAEAVKQQLVNTKAKLHKLRAWAKEAWAEADTITAEAETVWHRQQYPQALKLYIQALEAHTQAQQKSITAQCAEQVQLIQIQLQESQRVMDHCEIEHYCQGNYQKAIDARIQGETSLKNSSCQDALKCYKKAEEYFEQAIAQRHQQLKQKIILAQKQANEYQAQHYANTIYDNGQVLVSKAAELWDRSCYEQSYDSYYEASRLFEEASKFACHKIQKEEAETIQVHVRKAFEQAIAADAQELSSSLFQQAVKSEKQADAVFMDEDFLQAKNLYDVAIKQYAIASQQGLEQKKQQVIAARQQARESQKLAQQAGARAEQNVYQQAFLSYQNGERYVDQKAYKQALSAFELAHTGYQQAQQEAENEHIYQIMLAAKGRAEEEYRNAEHVGTAEYFGEGFTKALQLLEQAQHWNTLKKLEKATEFYEKAAKKFLQLSLETLLHIARQNLEVSRQRVLTIQGQVKPFRSFAERSWNEAQKLKIQAEKANQAKDYNKAIDIYEEAYEAYERTKVEAEHQQDKLRQVKEKKLKANTATKKSGFLGNSQSLKHWSIKTFFILFLIIGVYTLFGSSFFKKMIVYLNPPAELSVSKVLPMEEELSILDGQTQTFSLEVQNKEKYKLDYRWFLDGEEQAKDEKWAYKPAFSKEETAPKEVKVIITDQEGRRLEKVWRITVTSPPIDNKVIKINHPPEIIESSPSSSDIKQIKAGDKLDFSVQATDVDLDDNLTYIWFLDGEKVSVDKFWKFAAPASGGVFTVTVRVLDDAGLQAQRSWRITAAPPENHPPRIVEAKPSNREIALRTGNTINFSVNATDSDSNDQLTYTWSLDGQKISSSKLWPYKAQADGKHIVVLNVSDRKGLQAQRSWRITAAPPENHPPRIVEAKPSNREIALRTGDTINFSVNATDSDSNDQLTYTWSLDGQKISSSKLWPYKAQADGKHVVVLNVSDRKGLQAQQLWSIDIEPLSKPVAIEKKIEKNAKNFNPTTTKPKNTINEMEVKKWLEKIRINWEKKDTSKLVEMGGIDARNESKLKQALNQYNNFHVAFKNIDIIIKDNQATVSFTRVDTIEGQTLTHPDRKVIGLVKGSDGRLTVKK
ncbi:putative Calcium/calmodulin-dependent protein kinase [Candidatus Methylobacter favarea]|uniref:non-specific serine/threonine protein kinase n=1 Tax=Candidatus Methylobacter favarea TaxID=2707345 RepID=A0A8S0XHF0_9GAMM|nr:serine/threonine protein kinase [Candidatus Methylobacter favarea]CAA9889661.1 putative Calcium/calmodulin-dependent protein kinase [Candidatus Methylobacter favarea]